MTEEDRNSEENRALVIKDISARVFHGIYVKDLYGDEETNNIVKVISVSNWGQVLCEYREDWYDYIEYPFFIPILRHKSDMTENEREIYKTLLTDWERLDYLNSIGIDYRDLIEKGLAIRKGEDHYG